MRATIRFAATLSAVLMLAAPLAAQSAPEDGKGGGGAGPSDKPAATETWRGAKNKDAGLYPMNMTPFTEDGVLYGVDHPGRDGAGREDR